MRRREASQRTKVCRLPLVPISPPPKPCTLLWFALVAEDDCPACLGTLDTYFVCRQCGYDAHPYIDMVEDE